MENMEKEILLGQYDGEIYTAGLSTGEDTRGLEPYFSICGTGYRLPFMTAEEGEQRAREYLEDGELWKMTVQSGNTELGLAEWVEYVLDADGWEATLGDIHQVGGMDLYISVGSGGQCLEGILTPANYADIIKPRLSMQDMRIILRAWQGKERLHLKPIKDILKGKKTRALYDAVLAIFEAAPAFDTAQLAEYREGV